MYTRCRGESQLRRFLRVLLVIASRTWRTWSELRIHHLSWVVRLRAETWRRVRGVIDSTSRPSHRTLWKIRIHCLWELLARHLRRTLFESSCLFGHFDVVLGSVQSRVALRKCIRYAEWALVARLIRVAGSVALHHRDNLLDRQHYRLTHMVMTIRIIHLISRSGWFGPQ